MKKRSTTYRLNKVDYAIFIIFSIAAAVMLFLFYRDLNSFTIKQSEEPIAKIYFKRNTAQRKFVDNDIWEVLTNSSDIYDGDRIRTSTNSEAYTEFTDSGIQIQLREKSMVQIYKNKKERTVDFIGGEIYVATTKPEEKVVIHSGKNEISIAQVSEVKLALPEVSAAAAAGEEEAEESPVVIEVISGQVEVVEQPVAKKEKRETPEPAAPVVVSAGETITIVPEVEKRPEPVVEPKVELAVEPESVIESEPEPAVEAVEEIVVEAPVEVEVESPVVEETEELVIEEPKEEVPETKVATLTPAPAPAPIPAPEPVVEEKPAEVTLSANDYVKPEELYEPVEYNVEKEAIKKYVSFNRNTWYDQEQKQNRYNYYYSMKTSDVAGPSRKIPKGSTILFEFSGVANKDLAEIVIEISTGGKEWARANAWMSTHPDFGRGIKQGQEFHLKRYLTLIEDIVNTNNSNIGLCYDPDKLDQPLVINDLQVKFTVIPEGPNGPTQEIAAGYTNKVSYDTITARQNIWGKGSRDYNYVINMNADAVFGNSVSIPKGKKIKVSISGVSDKTIQRFHIELADNSEDKWTQVLLYKNDNDWGKLNFSENPVYKGRKFNITKSFTIHQDLMDTNSTKLSIVVDNENLREEPVFTDLEINFVIE